MTSRFFLHHSKNNPEALIILSLKYDGKRLNYSTKERIPQNCWVQKEQRPVRSNSKFPNHRQLEERLKQVRLLATEVYLQLVNKETEPSNTLLRQQLDTKLGRKNEDKMTLLKYMTTVFPRTKFKGKTRKPQSLKPYNQLATLLQQFNKETKRSIDFKDVNIEFYNAFIDFLRYNSNDSNGFTENTIGKHIGSLKAVLRLSHADNHHTNNFYQDPRFVAPTEEVHNIYLTDEEIDLLYNTDLSGEPNLAQTRDIFIIGCYTGLRYSDLHQIRTENITNGYLKLTTTKTENDVVIPLNPLVLTIQKKYGGQFPAPFKNPVMNRHLKEIGKLAGLNDQVIFKKTIKGEKATQTFKKYELICTHTARRSFASNMFKLVVPTLSIMAITGHRTEKAFLKYIKLSAEEHAKIMHQIMLEN